MPSFAEPNYGPFYTQLGYADTFDELRVMMEGRTGWTGNRLRMEEVLFCHIEGKSKTGCPLAKQVNTLEVH